MPEDVRKLVDDYDTCEHFAGKNRMTPTAGMKSKWPWRSSAHRHRPGWPS